MTPKEAAEFPGDGGVAEPAGEGVVVVEGGGGLVEVEGGVAVDEGGLAGDGDDGVGVEVGGGDDGVAAGESDGVAAELPVTLMASFWPREQRFG